MGATQSKKRPYKDAQKGVALSSAPTRRSNDFQTPRLDSIPHLDEGLSHSLGIMEESYGETSNGMPKPVTMPPSQARKRVKIPTPENHNTPTFGRENYELNTELLADLLRHHCEPDADIEIPRFMPLWVSQYPVNTGIPYLAQWHDLDVDVLLEILRYYVAYQTDGVFILMLLSTEWCNFVLHSPVLWQWVTIDPLCPDWAQKAICCLSLSAGYPLQVILRLPMMEWNEVVPLLVKCSNLFIEVPDYIPSKDVEEATRCLLLAARSNACEVHWYRAGDSPLTESRDPLTLDLSHLTTLRLDADGSEYPHYHQYAQTRDMRYKERGDSYIPLVLLKTFHILEVLRNACYLRNIVISHHAMDPIFLDLDLPTVTMIHLRAIEIRDIDFHRNGDIQPLVQSLRCPVLLHISLSGNFTDMTDTVRYFSVVGSPVGLSLSLVCEQYHGVEEEPFSSPVLQSVTSLSLRYMGPSFVDGECTYSARTVGMFVNGLHRLSEIHLFLPAGWLSPEKALQLLPAAAWERFSTVNIRLEDQDADASILNYTWEANQSIMRLSGLHPLICEFLDIVGETRNPLVLHLCLNGSNSPALPPRWLPPSVRCLRGLYPSVSTLHVEINGIQDQAWIIKDIDAVLKAFPCLTNLRFILPPWARQNPHYPMPTPAQSRNLQVFTLQFRQENDIFSALEYTKGVNHSIYTISGMVSVVMEFNGILNPLWSLPMSHIELPDGISIQLLCLHVEESDICDGKKLRALYAAFMERLDPSEPTVVCIILPSIVHYDELDLDTAVLCPIGVFSIEKEQASVLIFKSSNLTLQPTSALPHKANSIWHTKFMHLPEGQVVSPLKDRSLCGLLGIREAHVIAYFINGSLGSLAVGINSNSNTSIKRMEKVVDYLNNLLKKSKSLQEVNVSWPSNWGTNRSFTSSRCLHHWSIPGSMSGDAVKKYEGLCSYLKLYQWAKSVNFPSANLVKVLDITLGDTWRDVGLINGTFPCLTTIICTPKLLLALLSKHLIPKLQTIQLRLPTKNHTTEYHFGIDYFGTVVDWLIYHQALFPNLHTLGLSWFPPTWYTTKLLRSMFQSSKNRNNITLKLPSYPNPWIQEALKSAMMGLESRFDVSFRTYAQYVKSKPMISECYYCWSSDVPCRQDHAPESMHCSRHSPTSLVSLTKDTAFAYIYTPASFDDGLRSEAPLPVRRQCDHSFQDVT